jgi:putative transposase
MSRYIRSTTAGGTYFFTVTLRDRRASWLADCADDLRQCLMAVRDRHPFEVDAMVVLPDHLHALWTLPADDADFATRWMLIKQGFTKRLRARGSLNAGAAQLRRANGELGLWQRRYWEHQIRNDADYARHVDYIHFNPVKHGLVRRVIDWPHSSFHRFVRDGRLPADWGVSAERSGTFGE